MTIAEIIPQEVADAVAKYGVGSDEVADVINGVAYIQAAELVSPNAYEFDELLETQVDILHDLVITTTLD